MRRTGKRPPPSTGTVGWTGAAMTRFMVVRGAVQGSGHDAMQARRYTGQTMLPVHSIRHCRMCGAPAEYRVPPDDNRPRATCTACGQVHYENPLNVVGTVPVWQDQVLLCRRAIEPRYGLWTLPAGFMELGESTRDGALRETIEEAGAKVEMQELFTLL